MGTDSAFLGRARQGNEQAPLRAFADASLSLYSPPFPFPVHAGSIALLFSPLAKESAVINQKLASKFDFLAAHWLKGKLSFGDDATKPTSADLYLMWCVGSAMWKEAPVNDHMKSFFAHISALPAVAAAKAASDVAFATKA